MPPKRENPTCKQKDQRSEGAKQKGRKQNQVELISKIMAAMFELLLLPLTARTWPGPRGILFGGAHHHR